MDKATVTQQVIQAVAQVQEASGRSAEGIGTSTKPIGGAPGFDSLNGIEVTVALSQSLGNELPNDNLFVSEDGNRALSISEIADNLCKTLGVETEAASLETVRS